jgi:P-type Ca2+ transporter type 2C
MSAQKIGHLDGLSGQEALRRLDAFGPNRLPEVPPETLARIFLRQFNSPLIFILLFALTIDAFVWVQEGAHGFPTESVAILIILVLNAAIGTFQEYKADATLRELQSLAQGMVWALRDGHFLQVESSLVVPGDVIRVEAGDRIPADGHLSGNQQVMIDESILTGESVPIEKAAGALLYAGSLLLRGTTTATVTATGALTEMGKIGRLVATVTPSKTPLEKQLQGFAKQLTWAVVVLGLILVGGGIFAEGMDRVGHVFLFAVALAVAAVPEGLPAVLTSALAMGVRRMAQRNAIVRKLNAVEALGSVTVIATDKTGTLTENRLQVRDMDVVDPDRAMRAIMLANDADLEQNVGDSLELALLEHAHAQGHNARACLLENARLSARPFDSDYKFMSVTVDEAGQDVTYLKGAPEVLLERSRLSAKEKSRWHRKIENHASEGLKLLGLGWRKGSSDDNIVFLGFVQLWDPPRPETQEAIAKAQAAGIRTVMITGDHPATARAIAQKIGLEQKEVTTGAELEGLQEQDWDEAVARSGIFARVTPQQKLQIVDRLRASGHTVAVTGDGVNDAPALKAADVGIAMGKRGSSVAREAADIVLLDDNFATIVTAIELGRGIYANIQKFIRFFFSTDVALILLVSGGLALSFFLGLRDDAGQILLPLTAVQLLWINVVADGPPALALAFDYNEHMLNRRPREKNAQLLSRAALRFILLSGSIKAALGLAIFAVAPMMGADLQSTQTMIFLYESTAQIAFVYPSRRDNGPTPNNNALNSVVFLSLLLQMATVTWAPLRQFLGLSVLSISEFLWVTLAVCLSLAAATVAGRFLALENDHLPETVRLRR